MKDFVDILVERLASEPELTEAGLAKAAGLDNSTIRQMIKFHRSPRIETAIKICKALGTTIEEFMGQPQTEEERRILRLVADLPVALRLQLLGYGEGLAAAANPPLLPPPATDQ